MLGRRLLLVLCCSGIVGQTVLVIPKHAQASTATWINLTPSGAAPAARRDAGFTYLLAEDQFLLAGGESGDAFTWRLLPGPPNFWGQIPGANVPSTTGQSHLFYDAVNHDAVLLHSPTLALYRLDLDNPIAWVQVAVEIGPPARQWFAAAHDILRNRILIFGGGPTPAVMNDVWAISLNGTPEWVSITGVGTPPPPRWAPIAVYDPVGDRLIVATGALDGSYTPANDVWALTLSGSSTWSDLAPVGNPPPGRLLAAAAFDPSQNRVILWGGYAGSGLNDIHELWLDGAPAWSEIIPTGQAPAPRWSHRAVYDPSENQVVFFGGWNGGPLNDVWALGLTGVTGPPLITAFFPRGGRVGDPVTIAGARLEDCQAILFNGTSAPVLSANFGAVTTQVPPGATTGPISLTTLEGSVTTADSFFVGEMPVISAVNPPGAKIGNVVAISGEHFLGATAVSFGSASSASFAVLADTLISAVVDSAAVTGPVFVTTPAATGVSSFAFMVLPPDTAARIVSVKDVPNDQGGVVTVRWLPSDYDVAPHRWIVGYRVWRRAAPAGLSSSGTSLEPSTRVITSANGEPEFWESLGEIPARYLPGYAYTAPTTQDSISGSNPLTAFRIETFSADPFEFFHSAPDSGYSVDNLAPPAPLPFTAVYSSSGVALHWSPSRAADLSAYRLHRGTSVGFTPNAANLVVASPDTGYFDPEGAITHYYKLAAVDVHGNVGRFVVVSAALPTAALASLVSAEVRDGVATLRWLVAVGQSVAVRVYRRDLHGAWQARAVVLPDASGYVDFRDPDLVAATRVGYRLGLADGEGEETFAGEVWLDVPAAGVDGGVVVSNPVLDGVVRVSFSLRAGTSAPVSLFDVLGRAISHVEVAGVEGRTTVELGRAAQLAPGVYLVRVGLAKPVVARVVVVK